MLYVVHGVRYGNCRVLMHYLSVSASYLVQPCILDCKYFQVCKGEEVYWWAAIRLLHPSSNHDPKHKYGSLRDWLLGRSFKCAPFPLLEKEFSRDDSIKELRSHLAGVGVSKMTSLQCFSVKAAALAIQYFSSSIFKHYHLFKHLFSEEQEEDHVTISVSMLHWLFVQWTLYTHHLKWKVPKVRKLTTNWKVDYINAVEEPHCTSLGDFYLSFLRNLLVFHVGSVWVLEKWWQMKFWEPREGGCVLSRQSATCFSASLVLMHPNYF